MLVTYHEFIEALERVLPKEGWRDHVRVEVAEMPRYDAQRATLMLDERRIGQRSAPVEVSTVRR